MHTSLYGPEDAPPVLLLHGAGVAGWMWSSLRQSVETRHRVIIPDLPGHGESSGEEYISHSATVKALAELVMLLRGYPVAVVGFWLGAQLSIGLAAQHATLVSKVMVVSAQGKPMAGSRLIMAILGMSAPLARKRWLPVCRPGSSSYPRS